MALEHALVLTFSLFGGVTFVEADLPCVFTVLDRQRGQLDVNFRQVDLDGDGDLDLLFSREVAFQEDGTFPPSARVTLPVYGRERLELGTFPACDVWGRDVYLRQVGRLRILRWEDGDWQEELKQEISWPDKPDSGTTSHLPVPAWPGGAQLGRFLHDLDEDKTPEIIVAGEDGLHVYARDSGNYERTAVLDVFTGLRVSASEDVAFWPPDARRFLFPIRSNWCRVVVDGPVIGVRRWESLPDERLRYHWKRYHLDTEGTFEILPDKNESEIVDLDRIAASVRLNDDDVMDYVGGDWTYVRRSVVNVPIREFFASTDGGQTFQSFRVQAFEGKCPLVDFDSDGDQDIVMEPTGLFAGGVREMFGRVMTRRTFDVMVRIHLQDARGRFSKSPDVEGSFAVRLEETLFNAEMMMHRYQAGDLLDLTGDFDGDGYHDALIQDEAQRLAVYVYSGRAFQRKPEAVIPAPLDHDVGVTDIDGDGRSDVVVGWTDEDAEDSDAYRWRVYLSREGGP